MLQKSLFRLPVQLLLAVLLVLPAWWQTTQAAGELMVAPTRAVFEGRTRTAQVTLVNTGTEPSTYRIGFVQKRMLANGGFEDIDEALEGELFADNLVRFSPRQVTLAPGQAQVIRLLLRKPATLADGEYRSHLLFRSVPDLDAGIEGLSGQKSEGISIQLVPVLAISIPVIVRHGVTEGSAALSGLALSGETERALSFNIGRLGNRSLFGDLRAVFVPVRGEPKVVGQANGVAVYTPLPSRSFRLPLHLPEGVVLEQGSLRLTYRARSEDGGAVLAESELVLP